MHPCQLRACEALTEALAFDASSVSLPQLSPKQKALNIPVHLVYISGLVTTLEENLLEEETKTNPKISAAPYMKRLSHSIFEGLQKLYLRSAPPPNKPTATTDDEEEDIILPPPKQQRMFQLSPTLQPSAAEDQQRIREEVFHKMKELQVLAEEVEKALMESTETMANAVVTPITTANSNKPKKKKNHPAKTKSQPAEERSTTTTKTETLQEVLQQIQVPHQYDNNNEAAEDWIPVGQKKQPSKNDETMIGSSDNQNQRNSATASSKKKLVALASSKKQDTATASSSKNLVAPTSSKQDPTTKEAKIASDSGKTLQQNNCSKPAAYPSSTTTITPTTIPDVKSAPTEKKESSKQDMDMRTIMEIIKTVPSRKSNTSTITAVQASSLEEKQGPKKKVANEERPPGTTATLQVTTGTTKGTTVLSAKAVAFEPLSVPKLKPIPPLVVCPPVTTVTGNHPMDPTKAATATMALEQRVQALEEELATKQQELEFQKEQHMAELRKEREQADERLQALQLRLYISETKLKTYQEALEKHVHAVANNTADGSAISSPERSIHKNKNTNDDSPGLEESPGKRPWALSSTPTAAPAPSLGG